MPHAGLWAVGDVFWGDKGLQAAEFADEKPPHRIPVGTDQDYNTLINDYFSKTPNSSFPNIIAPTEDVELGVFDATLRSSNITNILEAYEGLSNGGLFGGSGAGRRILQLGPRGNLHLGDVDIFSTGVQLKVAPYRQDLNAAFTLLQLNASGAGGSYVFTTNNRAFTYLSGSGGPDYGTTTGGALTGLAFTPNAIVEGTLATFRGVSAGGSIVGGGTVTNYNAIEVPGGAHLTPNFGTVRGLYLNSLGSGFNTLTTALGIDINALPSLATNKYAIRQSGASDLNLWSGKSRFGDQTVPTMFLETKSVALVSRNVTANTTLTSGDCVVYGDAAGGSITITLPAATGVKDQFVLIIKKNSGINTVTVAPNGTDTINGGGNQVITTQWGRVTLVTDGVSNWTTLGGISL